MCALCVSAGQEMHLNHKKKHKRSTLPDRSGGGDRQRERKGEPQQGIVTNMRSLILSLDSRGCVVQSDSSGASSGETEAWQSTGGRWLWL